MISSTPTPHRNGSLYIIDYDEALSSAYAHLMSFKEVVRIFVF